MGEVVKVLLANSNDKETWSYEARDILLDTWTTLLAVSTVKIFFFLKQLHIFITLCMVVFMKLCGHIWLVLAYFVIVRLFINTCHLLQPTILCLRI